MNLTLFNIKDNYLKLISEIEENQGEISEEQIEQLEINRDYLQEKVSNYNEIISSKKSLNDRIDEEIKFLRKKKEINDKIIGRLEYDIVSAINLYGDIDIGVCKLSVKKTTCVEVKDIEFMDDKYLTTKIVKTPNKVFIGKCLKDGEEIYGCSLFENYHLKRSQT